jgi:uncharacterized C2H2 Zn-finger protein
MQKRLLKKSSNRRNVLQHNKGYIRQTNSQHHTKHGKTKTILCKIRKEPGCPLSPLLFNIVLEFVSVRSLTFLGWAEG